MASGPDQVWEMDLTSTPTSWEEWGYLFPVVDIFGRLILALDLFGMCRTRDGALNMAFSEGSRERGLRLVHDIESQVTSQASGSS